MRKGTEQKAVNVKSRSNTVLRLIVYAQYDTNTHCAKLFEVGSIKPVRGFSVRYATAKGV